MNVHPSPSVPVPTLRRWLALALVALGLAAGAATAVASTQHVTHSSLSSASDDTAAQPTSRGWF